MDDIQRWENMRKGFRLWLAEREYTELLDIAKDVSKRMEYEGKRLEEKDKFNKIMGNL